MIETRRDTVPSALDDERVDRVVAMLTEASRARVRTLIDGAHVRIGGVIVTKSAQRVRAGDEIVVEFDEEEPAVKADSTIALTVVHEDLDVVVVDKPAGLVVHPGAGHRDDTLVSALLARYPDIAHTGDPRRPGIVHRLDKGTSGLLMVARTPLAYDSLVAQLSARTVTRSYTALVCRSFEEREGVVDAPIGRSSRARVRRVGRRRDFRLPDVHVVIHHHGRIARGIPANGDRLVGDERCTQVRHLRRRG